jgi:ParB family chromosome partitioning protein
MATRKKQKGLGRGLDALLGADTHALDTLSDEVSVKATTSLPIEVLSAGKYQPRHLMDDVTIAALAESIRQQGVMQPLLVRRTTQGPNQYEVIAGERRLRAAAKAGLQEVPVIVKEVDDEQAAVMALIENIQREDLNPMEEARGIKRLLDEFAMTHEQIANAIGRSRSATSNLLRLINLTDAVQDLLLQSKIDMGHARALLSLDAAQQVQIANLIVAKQLSVREAEQLVSKTLRQPTPKQALAKHVNQDVRRMQDQLADELGTAVKLVANQKGKGQLTLQFHDWGEFEGLLQKMGLKHLSDQA